MRTLFKSLLIALGLWIILAIFGGFFNNPEGFAWIVILPAIFVFLILGLIIGLIIERIKGYKSGRKTYAWRVGLIFAIIGFLLALIKAIIIINNNVCDPSLYYCPSHTPSILDYFKTADAEMFFYPIMGFILGVLITFIIEKIKNRK